MSTVGDQVRTVDPLGRMASLRDNSAGSLLAVGLFDSEPGAIVLFKPLTLARRSKIQPEAKVV